MPRPLHHEAATAAPDRGPAPRPHAPEAGFMLLGVIVLCFLVVLALAVAAPTVARDLRRDKEVESAHRAEQYTRAIRLYTKRGTGPYPGSMEALEKSNNIRYLRQKYVDPLTGKSDWRIIHVGQNKTTVKGFFGEPLTGIAGPGLGSAAGLQSPGQPGATTGGSGGGTTGTSTDQGCNAGNSAFCQQKPTTSTSGGSPNGGTNASGTPGSSSLDSLSANTGGAIMGVGSSRSGDSILTPNEQETYDTWEFLYDPRIEKLYAASQVLGGGGIGSSTAGLSSPK